VTIFQLDQCLNDKTLADICNSQGMCTVYRYPRRPTDQLDEVMLPAVFSRNTTLLTTDRTIIEDNESSIAAPNPGVIVVKNKKPRPFMTADRAGAIIAEFKRKVPSWPTIDWSMIYIEIDDEGEAYVCPLVSGDITKGQPFNISSKNVNAELTRYIEEIHEALKGHLAAGPLTSEKPQQ
jgi:hypothetical protein